MTVSPHIGLPYLEAAQAQKHVTHNEALRILDALVMLSVIDRDLSAPPASPAEGDRYIVKAAGSGAFAGKDNAVAHYIDGGWTFLAPAPGWLCHVRDENVLLTWNGTAWAPAIASIGSELQNLALLGVGTAADATNPFAAKLNNALWTAKTVAESGDGDLRYKLNKEAAANTLSLLFQTGYSGRAEIGLVGDDDLHVKVSADGSSWINALSFDRASGAAKLNAGVFLTGDLSPAQITADQNDFNPSGLAGGSLLRLTADAARNITGLSGGGDGRVMALINVGAQALVLKSEHAGSSAGNRFGFAADVTLASKQGALLWYDATDSRWKLLAGAQAATATRERLTANRTYYVRTDGSDSNSGLANTSGGAFLTGQKAINTIADALDLNGYNVTIQVADGTHTGNIYVAAPWVGRGTVTLRGNTTTPANCVLSPTSGNAVEVGRQINGSTADYCGALIIGGFKITATNAHGLVANECSRLLVDGAMEFGSCGTGAHLRATRHGEIVVQANCTISGNAASHWAALNNGAVSCANRTLTLTGSPVFSSGFALSSRCSSIVCNGDTFSGSTGSSSKRYATTVGGAIDTGGGGASYLPGDTAGSDDGTGIYV